MADAIDWDDSATVSGKPVAPEDAWHVAIAPDDVKVVSLEQLDDMFRLSLVDSETKVWQPGMRGWVSLGEVAGLDDEPAPPPKRTHPKPPSPRSAPPPPRSLPPPALRVSAAPVASPSFYAQPLAPVSYAAPLASIPTMAPIASVRPLVVSHNPYPMPQRGGGFGRFIVGLALVAGVGITLYRNDVLRDAAHSIHQDGLYARLEQKLGGPSFGTLRAIQQSATTEAAASLTMTNADSAALPAKAASDSAVLANVAAAPTPNPIQTAASSTGKATPVVSLESLGTERGGASAKAAVAAVAPTPRPAAASFVSAPVAKAAPPPPEPKAVKAAPAEKPAPPPAATKPESEMTPRERLNAEIAKSMAGSPATAKKSKPASTGLKGSGEYDPLNPKL